MQSTFEVGSLQPTPKCNINDFKINLKALFHNCGLAVGCCSFWPQKVIGNLMDFDAQLKTHVKIDG